MAKRILTLTLALPALLLTSLAFSPAQDAKGGKGPEWKHALDLRVRKAGEDEFTAATKKIGLEVYQDDNGGAGIHITDPGALSVMAPKLFKPADGKIKEPKWQHGLTLAARKADDKEFTKDTRRFGIEVFKDDNNGNLIYIGEAGHLDTVPAKYASLTEGKVKTPVWKHAMNLRVRKAGEKDFTKDTKKLGIEVFKDDNNGNLVYVSELGNLAVVPGKLVDKDLTGKGPEWKHGLELAVRKAGEKEFGKDTKKFSIEVYLDENNGNLIYIGETGALTVVPGKIARAPGGETKSPEWKHAMELSARKAGEKEFTPTTKKYGVEVYRDENNGNLIYIAETGEFSVAVPTAD